MDGMKVVQCGSLLGVLVFGLTVEKVYSDGNSVYAVRLSASVQESPPQITLRWMADPNRAQSYTVYRKAPDSQDWGGNYSLSGDATEYVDGEVAVGVAYEYRVEKLVTSTIPSYRGYGYIYTGIAVPLIENRGTLILIIADTAWSNLSNELLRLEEDQIGDGWQIVHHVISSTSSPEEVKTLITTDYLAAPANVTAVLLFGEVPVFRCGNLNVDGHGSRAMPADAFYGDMDGYWYDSPSYLPSDVELMVGRVDLSNMPGQNAATPWPSEIELLRNYLNKDHRWRHKMINVPSRAIVANRFDSDFGEAFSASGWRNFEPLVGPGNIVEANVQDNAPVGQRWITLVASNSFLWSDGCGAGSYTTIGSLGTRGMYHDVWSVDIVGRDTRFIFGSFWGSWFCDWDSTDNIMRAPLATPTMGLATCWVGRPHWYFHHMGLGEPIGYSTRLSMNNYSLYQNQSNAFTRGIHIALMGDPTLRLHPVAPPANFDGVDSGNGVQLTWSGSADNIVGYHVYRANSSRGPFLRVTGSLLSGTTFTDSTIKPGFYSYMVRAVKLQLTSSGSYLNPSQGIFASVNVTSTPPVTVTIVRTLQGPRLTWNSVAGMSYWVMSKQNLENPTWLAASGNITASGPSTSWTDTSGSTNRRAFYRIVLQ